MEKYLLHLLENNTRVIIPELGAFILRKKDPRKVDFNDLLAFNDGMLMDFLEKNEGLTYEESKIRIGKFAGDIKNRLSKGETVTFRGLGSLKMDDSGKITFSEAEVPDEIPVRDAESIPKTEDKTVKKAGKKSEPARGKAKKKSPGKKKDQGKNKDTGKKKVPVKKKTEKESFILEDKASGVDVDATGDIPVISSTEEPPFTIEPEVRPAKPPKEVQSPSDEPGTGSTGTQPLPEEPESGPHVESTGTSATAPADETGAGTPGDKTGSPAPPDKTKTGIPENETGAPEPQLTSPTTPPYTYARAPKNKKLWPWIVGASVLLIIALLVAWLVFPGQVNSLLSRDDAGKTEIPPIESTAGDIQDAGPAEEEEVDKESRPDETVPASHEETAPTGRQYYVVAGCFKYRENAEAYVSKLRSMGYDSRIFGMRKNLHAVCFSSYPGKSEALAVMRKIRREYDPEAWVLYY